MGTRFTLEEAKAMGGVLKDAAERVEAEEATKAATSRQTEDRPACNRDELDQYYEKEKLDLSNKKIKKMRNDVSRDFGNILFLSTAWTQNHPDLPRFCDFYLEFEIGSTFNRLALAHKAAKECGLEIIGAVQLWRDMPVVGWSVFFRSEEDMDVEVLKKYVEKICPPVGERERVGYLE